MYDFHANCKSHSSELQSNQHRKIEGSNALIAKFLTSWSMQHKVSYNLSNFCTYSSTAWGRYESHQTDPGCKWYPHWCSTAVGGIPLIVRILHYPSWVLLAMNLYIRWRCSRRLLQLSSAPSVKSRKESSRKQWTLWMLQDNITKTTNWKSNYIP